MNSHIVSTAEEWDAVVQFCMDHQTICPPSQHSVAAVATDDSGAIHGVWFAQLAIQLHPLVTDQVRESGRVVNLRHLHRVLEDGVRDIIGGGAPVVYYMFMEAEREKQIRALCDAGMLLLPPQAVFVGVTPPLNDDVGDNAGDTGDTGVAELED